MQTFLSVHQDELLGVLNMFDRIIFKGHLTQLFMSHGMLRLLAHDGVLLKDFSAYVQQATAQIKAHAEQLAQAQGRPCLYLESALTAGRGQSKEDLARAIAQRDGITDGLVCVLRTLEGGTSFDVQKNSARGKLELKRRPRKCLHYYFYYLDPEFGWMHIRLQSWFPFAIQIYVNGHEWLARQLDRAHIGYERYDNSLTRIDDMAMAQRLCAKFEQRHWVRVLQAFARQVNPLLPHLRQAGVGEYYWCVDQCEYASDVMFRDRATLQTHYPDWLKFAVETFDCQDVLVFLGRKYHGNLQGEVTGDLKRRPQGRRLKYYLKGNSLKLYDKASVLRVETTINRPREFKVLRVSRTVTGQAQRQWKPMGKGVANFWRYAQVARHANQRYLDALTQAPLTSSAIQQLDQLGQPKQVQGRRFARFQPVSAADTRLFAAVLQGAFALNGFRNQDVQAHLFDQPPTSDREVRYRSECVSRQIAKLRAHGLVAKVKEARLYRVTPLGYRLMAAAIQCRTTLFPAFCANHANVAG